MTRFWITLEQGVEFVLRSLQDMEGGEIFIPRIPSMSMVEVAKAIAPDCTFKIIGIRPGEKLHEVLVTEDEGRTVMQEDRYIVYPPWKNVGGPIRFASNQNEKWLSREEFRSLAGLTAHPSFVVAEEFQKAMHRLGFQEDLQAAHKNLLRQQSPEDLRIQQILDKAL